MLVVTKCGMWRVEGGETMTDDIEFLFGWGRVSFVVGVGTSGDGFVRLGLISFHLLG